MLASVLVSWKVTVYGTPPVIEFTVCVKSKLTNPLLSGSQERNGCGTLTNTSLITGLIIKFIGLEKQFTLICFTTML